MKLLYLEDDHALANITQRALKRVGFEVSYSDSIEGLSRFQEQNYFSHALLDMKLEDGNALEVIPQLVEQHDNIKILLLTGYASIANAVKAVKLGAWNYLPKPAGIEEIVAAFESDESPIEESATMSLKRLEWEKIQTTLEQNNGNISLTAKQLNMHRRTLQRKLAKKPTLN
jgi:two-component system response regulator RegA